MPAAELAIPSLAVLITGSLPTVQYPLKKIGKKEAMTVVAKAELAQSYRAHPNIALRSSFTSRTPPVSQKTLRGQRRVFRPVDAVPRDHFPPEILATLSRSLSAWALDAFFLTKMSAGVTDLP